MPKVHGYRKKKRTHTNPTQDDVSTPLPPPKSLVARKGKTTKTLKSLVSDIRLLMSPWCAMKLKESRFSKIKDYVFHSRMLGVTHLQFISQTEEGTYYKLINLPNGPTLTFKVESYSLSRDVKAMQKRPRTNPDDYSSSPLVIMSGFRKETNSKCVEDEEGDVVEGMKMEDCNRLIVAAFSGIFPSVDIRNVEVSKCKRVALFVNSEADETITLRHYAIVKKPTGMTRGVRKLLVLKPSKALNLGNARDVCDYIASGGSGYASDSEYEDAADVSVPGSTRLALSEAAKKVAITLVELGPRMVLKLVKIEEEVCSGKVLYHRYIYKTGKEIMKLEEESARLKAKRRTEFKEYEKAFKSSLEASKVVTNEANNRSAVEDSAGESNAKAKVETSKFNPFSFKQKRKRGEENGDDAKKKKKKKLSP